MTKRRIMREFVISEISVVDKPAQEGATARLLKRGGADPKDAPLHSNFATDRFLRERQRRRNLEINEADMTEPESFEEAVSKLRAQDVTLKSAAARTLARQQFPHLVALMQREADAKLSQAHERPVQKTAVTRFVDLVEKHQRATGCSRLDALRKCRAANPAAFRALQEA